MNKTIGADGDDALLRGLAFSLNLNRRHLTREQKREIVAESLKSDPQLSDREHGRRTGVSKNTAAAIREELEESGQIDHFSERVDPRTGNASQSASKPKPAIPEDAPDLEHGRRTGVSKNTAAAIAADWKLMGKFPITSRMIVSNLLVARRVARSSAAWW